MNLSLSPFAICSPRMMSMWLFPPRIPRLASRCARSTTDIGNRFELFTEYRLRCALPGICVASKYMIHVCPEVSFECDLVILQHRPVPLRPDITIIECKSYSTLLPHYCIPELFMRTTLANAKGGYLFTRGRFSRRSLAIASLLGIKVMQYNPYTNHFHLLSHENPTPFPLFRPLPPSML